MKARRQTGLTAKAEGGTLSSFAVISSFVIAALRSRISFALETWSLGADFGDPWIYVVLMQLRDGRKVEWMIHSELERILFQVASERIIIGY
jgi:hypothetical protein